MVDYVRCLCGWVHFAVPLASAQLEIARFNAYAERAGIEHRSSLDSYLRCRRCRADTAQFERFTPEREPGYTMLPVVVKR
jgi:hypothetical protein